MANAESLLTTPLPLVVLISGSGSNLQAIIDQIDSGALCAEIKGVISNREDAYGLARARAADMPTTVLDHRAYADRQSFDQALKKAVDAYHPELIILAGFMRILTPEFVNAYAGKLLNIHPSLLPKFRGLNTHERALAEANTNTEQNLAKMHGCSVHFVTEELDGGPIIAQSRIKIEAGDSPESLAVRVQHEEHKLYPLCIQWLAEGKIKLSEQGVACNGKLLPKQGLQFNNSDYSQLATL